MKNIKERISYFGKMILVFPEAFLSKLTKPKSRGEFDDTASAVGALFLIVSLILFSILFFVNWLTSYGGKNQGAFSDGVFSEYRGFYILLSLSVAFFFVKSLFFAGSRGYSDFLSECTLREKKPLSTRIFDLSPEWTGLQRDLYSAFLIGHIENGHYQETTLNQDFPGFYQLMKDFLQQTPKTSRLAWYFS